MVPPPLLRRIRLTILALVAAIGALAWSIAAGPAETAGVATHPAHRLPLTDVAPYGANFFLEREADPWNRAQTVRLAEEAGIRYAKQHFLWAYIEPEPGRFEWSTYDAIVDLYRSHDIEVVARLDWPPAWVPKAPWVPASFAARTNAPPADVGLFARFAGAVAEHYRGRVRFYQIWNEPNLLEEWGYNPAHPVDPREYADLLEAAADAIRHADPNAVILSAPLAINLERVETAGNMNDLDYLRGLYAADAADSFDVLSANAFGMDRPPDDPPAPEQLNFRRVELQRRVMVESGDGGKPVWFAEYGWNAAPPDAREARWRRVSEVDQAAWTVGGVDYAAEHWPWAGAFHIWFFRPWEGRGHLTPDRAVYHFRMVDVDWTPRRVYAEVQMAAARRAIAGPGFWSERSAPVRLPRDLAQRDLWTWAWAAEGADDRNVLVSAEPGARLDLAFDGAAVAGRFEVGPQGSVVLVEVDGRSVSAPGGGQPLSLAGDRASWKWRTLAEGLGPGPHVLSLGVGTVGGQVVIDGFRVDPHGGTAGRETTVPLVLGGTVLLLGAVLVGDVRRAARRVAV